MVISTKEIDNDKWKYQYPEITLSIFSKVSKQTPQTSHVRTSYGVPLMSSKLHPCSTFCTVVLHHDDVIRWKHFPRNWPFVRGIHRSPVNSPHKGQWREALMFSLIFVWINDWVNNHEAGDLRRYRSHYDVIVMMHCRVILIGSSYYK